MQKKIIALAIASALTAPALALADVTLYGQANVSVDMVNDGRASSATTNSVDSNTSRLGVKGSEDLGNGLSAIAQAEGTVLQDSAKQNGSATATAFAFDRDTFLGLSSTTYGTLLAGQHDTPYKMATRSLDLFGDGIADNRYNQSTNTQWGKDIMMGAGHDVRLGNVVAYVSPNLNGVTIAAAAVFGAEQAAASSNKGSAYSLAAMYSQGPWYGAFGYQTIKLGDPSTGDLAAAAAADQGDTNTAFKLGGSYSVDQFAVNAVFEHHSYDYNLASAGTNYSGTNYYLAAKYNITSADDVKIAYTHRGSTATAGQVANDATQTSVGYDHSLSKATSVYVLYSKLTDNGVTAGVGNPDPSAFSLGMKHSF